MDYSNIPTGLKITSQIPLDVKKYVKDEATLAYLGVDDNLAFTYHDQLEVLCLAEKSVYIWREVQPGEENTGLVPTDFTYPLNIISYGIDYSNKIYNFFPLNFLEVKDVKTYEVNSIGSLDSIPILLNTTDINNEVSFNLNNLISQDNSVIIEQIPNVGINFKINQTWLQSWLLLNQSVICEITNNCSSPLFAVNDNFGAAINPLTSNSYEIEVLNNDNLGTLPTNIINVSEISPITTGLSLSIAPDNQSIFMNVTIPGYTLNSGQIYSFTYTIQDSTLATSTATVYFEDVS